MVLFVILYWPYLSYVVPIFAICNFGGYEVASKKIEFIQSIFQPDAKKAKKLKAPDFNKDPTFQFVVPAEYKDMVEADQKTKEVEATAASK